MAILICVSGVIYESKSNLTHETKQVLVSFTKESLRCHEERVALKGQPHTHRDDCLHE